MFVTYSVYVIITDFSHLKFVLPRQEIVTWVNELIIVVAHWCTVRLIHYSVGTVVDDVPSP